MTDLNQMFDAIRCLSLYTDSDSSMEYINRNTIIRQLPDNSLSMGDLITLLAVRISKDGFYDVYTRSLSNKMQFSASFRIPGEWKTQEHSMNYIALLLVLQGTMFIRFEDHTERFEAGELCLIRRGVPFSDLIKPNDTIILYLGIENAFFNQSFLSDFGTRSSDAFIRDLIVEKQHKHDFVRFAPKSAAPELPRLYLSILTEFLDVKPGYSHLIKGYSERILSLLPVEYNISLTSIEHKEFLYRVYQDVVAYIESHYATVTATELSHVFGYNPDYFNRLIRRFSGKTYTRLLQETRMKAAASLLETTALSVERIASDVGCGNLGLFYRAFKSLYHCTPKEYRRSKSPLS